MHTERTTDGKRADPAIQSRADPAIQSRIRDSAHHEQVHLRVIVGAAIISSGRVLACARSNPPEVAGKWEFPGGKVEPGETEIEALVRECEEELGVLVDIGARVGTDVRLAHGRAVLKVYAATLSDGHVPQALEHAELRWLGATELDTVEWLPADAPIVAALPPLLAAGEPPGSAGD